MDCVLHHPLFTLLYSLHHATGNIYLNPDDDIRQETKKTFEEIALSHGLKVLFWRRVPRDSSVIGPMSRQKEPVIEQPFLVSISEMIALNNNGGHGGVGQDDYKSLGNGVGKDDTKNTMDEQRQDHFERQLYLLRKHSTHTITMHTWFYICSLSSKNIIYKGRLSPSQVYPYFGDLRNPRYVSHFALVHSRFSTNTFPSWDRAQPLRWSAHNGKGVCVFVIFGGGGVGDG